MMWLLFESGLETLRARSCVDTVAQFMSANQPLRKPEHSPGRLVIVSNRVPVPGPTITAASGLATGILDAHRGDNVLWVGWNGERTRGTNRPVTLGTSNSITFATFPLDAAAFELFYRGYCNSVLWPVFHALSQFVRRSDGDFENYLRVNRQFARTLVTQLRPDDTIWVHDYHLLPVAAKLRKLGVRNPIGFFLHVPFPQPDLFLALPEYAQLLDAIRAYDLFGVQTQHDLFAFHTHDLGHRVCSIVSPIGIDATRVQNQAAAIRPDALQSITSGINTRWLIVGADRLDYSKGLMNRLAGFESLLERFPETRGHATLLQVAAPTRFAGSVGTNMRNELQQLATKINARFATPDWTPVRVVFDVLDRDLILGLLRRANVGLVTPLRDGMNLVAKEFVAAQDPQDPGVLVLSKTAGAAAELTDAILVDPFDRLSIANGLAAGLQMSRVERQIKHQAMLATVQHNDARRWQANLSEALAKRHPGLAASAN